MMVGLLARRRSARRSKVITLQIVSDEKLTERIKPVERGETMLCEEQSIIAINQ